MSVCPSSFTRFTPDAWSLAFLGFLLVAGFFQTRFAIRSIRERRMKAYRDPRLDPVGGRAVAYAVALLFGAWAGIGALLWVHACGSPAIRALLHLD